ncbi:unnamed protein product [Acanthosepion pharaonis]|uniref:Uncharacterized protein n=1 Tax=Acanthosepion pharaonis TaxID=158019 RepID=A0A812ERI7_ACAPH|nr:unnamed protein product [Sepia pharaonis]
MENNSSVTYKEDIPKTDLCSNTHKNQHNSANGHSIQTPPYNACVNQENVKNGSQSNLYGGYYADCFKSNNAVDTTPQNNFYRTFSETCRTPTNPSIEPTFYDSYTVPFSIAVTHPSSQSSPQGHHHQRSPPTPLNTARQRNQFPRQKLASRRTSFQDSNPDSQNQRYVMLREITPEIYHNTKQFEKTFHLPNVCPQATKKAANEQPAGTTAKSKHRSAPHRLANTHKKSTVGHGRKTETASQTLISGQDVLLSSYVIDDDGLASEMEGASLKKRGRPFKKISSRLLKCASKSFRDAGKSRTKKSPKWDKQPSEKATLKTKSDALADDMYLWADDFSLEEINNVERSPSSLFLRSKSRHFFENARGTPCIMYLNSWDALYYVPQLVGRPVLCILARGTPCIMYLSSWDALHYVPQLVGRPALCTLARGTPCIMYLSSWDALHYVPQLVGRPALCTSARGTPCIMYLSSWDAMHYLPQLLGRPALCTSTRGTPCIMYLSSWDAMHYVPQLVGRPALCTLARGTPCIMYLSSWDALHYVPQLVGRPVLYTRSTEKISRRLLWDALHSVSQLLRRTALCTTARETHCIMYQ